MSSIVVRSRIDNRIKNEADEVLRSMGLTLSDGIRLFLYQVVAQHGLPFSLKAPNKLTLEAIKAAENGDYEEITLEGLRKQWDKE